MVLTQRRQTLADDVTNASRTGAHEGDRYDVAIVGGGIVGTTLAVALKDSGLTVALIEAQTEADAIAKGQAYAIHLSSKKIWEAIGVWPAIEPHVEVFRQVQLSDADYSQIVTFTPQDLKEKVLGHVAEHRVLQRELLNFLHQHCPNVTLYNPCQVTQFQQKTDSVSLTLTSLATLEKEDLGTLSNGMIPPQINARLLVGADGANSRVRQAANIPVRGKKYHQSCLVATISTEQSHGNVAYEKFWPSGPFAILPSRPDQCRIVWTAPHEEAKKLLNLTDEVFLQQLQHRYGTQMGQLDLASQRYLFPAQLQHAKHYVRPRIALVGNAAHTCHPVGGQGLNLGIRDAAALARTVCQAHRDQQDIGGLQSLKRYEWQRKRQNILSLGFTDLLNRLFSNEIPVIQWGRRLGLRLMQWIPFVRITALKFMAGLLTF